MGAVVSSFPVSLPMFGLCGCARVAPAADLTAVCSVGPCGAQVRFRGAAELGVTGAAGSPALVLGALVLPRCSTVYLCTCCPNSGVCGHGAAQSGDGVPRCSGL